MRRLRSATFDGLWACWTALFGLAIPILAVLDSPPRTVRLLSRVWVRGVLALLAGVVGLRYGLRGGSGFPQAPCLIIANHQSTWETLAALVLFPDVAVVAKRELLRIPVLGWYLRHSAMIIIDRDEGSKALRAMAARSREALAEGRSVLIFPEGTRKKVGEPIEFRRGVELLYRSLEAPVAPVVVNSGSFWPLGHEPKRPGRITVSILTSIPPGLNAAHFATATAALMQSEVAVLEGRAYPANSTPHPP